MRIVYVAGFFKHVKEALEEHIPAQLDNRSVIWIPQVSAGEANVNLFKQSFFDLVERGASEILVLLALLRNRDYVFEVFRSLIEEGQKRSEHLRPVRIEAFANARDSAGVLNKIREFAPTSARELDFPDSLDGIADWVRQYLDGKLILHARAERGAKDSAYTDVRLVYRALRWLGEEYRTMKMKGAAESGDSLAMLAEMGIELGPSISAESAGEQGEDYFIRHGPQQDRRMLDLHLKKGSDRDASNCLRIYFFWDDDANCVVIGWLTSHLETRNS